MNIKTTQRPPVVQPKPAPQVTVEKEAVKESYQSEAFQPNELWAPDGSLLAFARSGVGTIAGTGAAVTGAIVYGSAGGAEGLVHGAKIPDDVRVGIRNTVMAGNLAAAGFIGAGLGGGATTVGVAAGLEIWKATSPETKQEVADKAHSWTDKANDWVDSVWPDPGEVAPLESKSRRVLGGVVGEIAGSAAGIVYDLTEAFGFGKDAGEVLVDGVTTALRGE